MGNYSYAHRQLRKRWAKVVEAGEAHCWRCGRWLHPQGPWDLGHDDRDKSVYRGPECLPCNRGTAAARGNRSRHAKKRNYAL
jgi:hypothetical protein